MEKYVSTELIDKMVKIKDGFKIMQKIPLKIY